MSKKLLTPVTKKPSADAATTAASSTASAPKKPNEVSIASTENLPVPNLESYVLIWLDGNISKTRDNIKTLKELKQLINYIKTFDNIEQCESYIQQICNEKIVLIVSGGFGSQIIPRINNLQQFSSCYVYCQDKTRNEEWAKTYSKIKGVFVRRDELVAQIAADQTARSKADDIIPISFFTRNDINNNSSLESRNANFLWFQLFIEVLLRMYHTSSSRNELINFCKKNYAGNESEEEMIAEFEHKYKPDDAIRWYTRNTCLYRMLNKALRIHDFGTIFVLRSFITDIAKQLKKENERFVYATMGDKSSNSSSIIKVYRGQSISVDELNLMQLNINEFISMSCFLSTSKSRLTALKFASQSDVKPNTERILFEINIDIRLTKDFADVKHLSWFGGEDEVLIKLGTIFRIEKIIYDKKEQLWIAMVSLASEDDYGLKDLFSHMKHKIGEETNLNSLGKILIEMGQYDTAANYYEQYEKESQIAMADALFGLGFAAYRNKNYDKSLYSQTKALELREKLYSSHHPDVAQCHMHIGNVYLGKKVYNAALNYYKKALEIQEKTLDDNHPDFDKTYINIAAAHRLRGEYELALEYYDKGLQIQRIHLPSSHYDIGLTYHHIGHAYKGMHDYTKAMEYYEKATHIYRKTLPPSHKYIEQIENDKREIEQKLNLK